MSGQGKRSLGQPPQPTAKSDGLHGDSDAPEVNEPAAQVKPAQREAAETATPALPRRTGGILLPVMLAGTIQQQPGPELLRRVLDGLKKL